MYVKHERGERGGRAQRVTKPSYRALHARIESARGKAASYKCQGCGGPAEQWAYDLTDMNDLQETFGTRTIRYSLDITKYLPLCRGCHVRLDRYGKAPK